MSARQTATATETGPSLESIDTALMEGIAAVLLFTDVARALAKTLRSGTSSRAKKP